MYKWILTSPTFIFNFTNSGKHDSYRIIIREIANKDRVDIQMFDREYGGWMTTDSTVHETIIDAFEQFKIAVMDYSSRCDLINYD